MQVLQSLIRTFFIETAMEAFLNRAEKTFAPPISSVIAGQYFSHVAYKEDIPSWMKSDIGLVYYNCYIRKVLGSDDDISVNVEFSAHNRGGKRHYSPGMFQCHIGYLEFFI